MRTTITDLAGLTGLDRNTIAKRLKAASLEPLPDSPPNARQYESVIALPALYSTPTTSTEAVRHHRARLLQAQAERARWELEKDRAEWMPKADHAQALVELANHLYRFCTTLPGDLDRAVDGLGVVGYHQLDRAIRALWAAELAALYAVTGQLSEERRAALEAELDTLKKMTARGTWLDDPDDLERFANSEKPCDQHKIRIGESAWIHYGNARLPHLLELERQIQAIAMPVPHWLTARIAAAAQADG